MLHTANCIQNEKSIYAALETATVDESIISNVGQGERQSRRQQAETEQIFRLENLVAPIIQITNKRIRQHHVSESNASRLLLGMPHILPRAVRMLQYVTISHR